MTQNAPRQYVYPLDQMDRQVVNQELSTSRGVSVAGERMTFGLVHKARGTGSLPHRHRSEQFNFVLQGTLQAEIDGKTYLVPKGSLIHIPANVVHSIIATPEEDVVFCACKDTRDSLGDGVAAGAPE
jgi:quercetin dioxygenase-like cupin family protein